jgi:hypothetical protein
MTIGSGLVSWMWDLVVGMGLASAESYTIEEWLAKRSVEAHYSIEILATAGVEGKETETAYH